MSQALYLVLGASGHGTVIADALPPGSILGFLDDAEDCPLLPAGLRRIGAFRDLASVARSEPGVQLVVALGDNALRERVVRSVRAEQPTLRFATVVHPSASVSSSATLGPGSVVCAGAVVGPGAKVGAHAIINTRASLDHQAELADFASLAPASATGGTVRIGMRSHVGMGAMVHHGIFVGGDVVIGSLSLVDRNLPDRVVAVGIPARVVRTREPGERYL